ncbi:hypothetical protein EVJ58_g2083 [Rhodofomes roseus]|uniref:Uncharacterized protein n=1 Tax=Rhodofomes roseus TaxID=34475 RepID=A0A4Y9YU21_9APHY|nr:hypothetical protein EVJ58_g2083 [Rhodofomes roseus]
MLSEPSLPTNSWATAGAALAGVAHTRESASRVYLAERQRSQHPLRREGDDVDMSEGQVKRG